MGWKRSWELRPPGLEANTGLQKYRLQSAPGPTSRPNSGACSSLPMKAFEKLRLTSDGRFVDLDNRPVRYAEWGCLRFGEAWPYKPTADDFKNGRPSRRGPFSTTWERLVLPLDVAGHRV